MARKMEKKHHNQRLVLMRFNFLPAREPCHSTRSGVVRWFLSSSGCRGGIAASTTLLPESMIVKWPSSTHMLTGVKSAWNISEAIQRSQSVCAMANETVALICRQTLFSVKLMLQILHRNLELHHMAKHPTSVRELRSKAAYFWGSLYPPA